MNIGQRFNPYRVFTGVFIPDAVYHYPRLSATAKLVYGRLCKFKGQCGQAYPAVKTLAKELNLNERQVFNHLTRLVEEKFIEREHRDGTSTVYHLLWHACFEADFEDTDAPLVPPKGGMQENTGVDGGMQFIAGGHAINCRTTPAINCIRYESVNTSPLTDADDAGSAVAEQDAAGAAETPEAVHYAQLDDAPLRAKRQKNSFRLGRKSREEEKPNPNSTSEVMRRMREGQAPAGAPSPAKAPLPVGVTVGPPPRLEDGLEAAIQETARNLRMSHPPKRRNLNHAMVCLKLREILQFQKIGPDDTEDYLAEVEQNHRRWTRDEQWTREDGRFAPGLKKWLEPEEEQYDTGPTIEAPVVYAGRETPEQMRKFRERMEADYAARKAREAAEGRN